MFPGKPRFIPNIMQRFCLRFRGWQPSNFHFSCCIANREEAKRRRKTICGCRRRKTDLFSWWSIFLFAGIKVLLDEENLTKNVIKSSRTISRLWVTWISHNSKSQIFVQKFNSDKTPTCSWVFHPNFFNNFSREIKVVNS